MQTTPFQGTGRSENHSPTSSFVLKFELNDRLLSTLAPKIYIISSCMSKIAKLDSQKEKTTQQIPQQKINIKTMSLSNNNILFTFRLIIFIMSMLQISYCSYLNGTVITNSTNKHYWPITVLKMSQDNRIVASADQYNKVKIWTLNYTQLTFVQQIQSWSYQRWWDYQFSIFNIYWENYGSTFSTYFNGYNLDNIYRESAQTIVIWNNGQKIFLKNNNNGVSVYQFNVTSQLYCLHSSTSSVSGQLYGIYSIQIDNDGDTIYVGHVNGISIFKWDGLSWGLHSMPTLSTEYNSFVLLIKLTNNQQKLVVFGVQSSNCYIKIFFWNGTCFLLDQTISNNYLSKYQNCKLSVNQKFISCYGLSSNSSKKYFNNYKFNSITNKFDDVSQPANFSYSNIYDAYMDENGLYTTLQSNSDDLYRHKFEQINGNISYFQNDSYSFSYQPRRIASQKQSKFQLVGDSFGRIHLLINGNFCTYGYYLNKDKMCACIAPSRQITGVCDPFNQINMTNCLIAQRKTDNSIICKKCNQSLNQILFNGACICKINQTPSLDPSKPGCFCQPPYRIITGVCDYFNSSDLKNCLVAERIPNSTIIFCKFCQKPAHQTVRNGKCVCQTGFTYSNATNKCQQTCGDGSVYLAKCDDGNTIDGDGCSSLCIPQPGFYCDNKSPTYCKSLTRLQYSQRILSNRLKQKLIGQLRIQLLKSMRNIPFSIMKQNFLPVEEKIRFYVMVNQNTSEQIELKNLQILFVDDEGTLVINFPFYFTLQNMKGRIVLDYENTRYMNTTQEIKFTIKGQTMPLIYVENLQTYAKLSYVYLLQTILSILILFIGIFTSKFIGLEMILGLQLIYFSQLLISNPSKWPIGFSFLKHLKFATGFSNLIQYSSYVPSSDVEAKFSILEISKNIIQNFNIGCILLILSFLIFLMSFLIENITANDIKRLNQERKVTQKYKLQQLQSETKMQLIKHQFRTNINLKAFSSAINFAIWSILPFIATIAAFLFIKNKKITINQEKVPLNSQHMGYMQKCVCFFTMITIWLTALNLFRNVLINKIINNKLYQKKQQLIYKRALFIYLLIIGCLIMFFNDQILFGLPFSVYVIILHSFFIVFLIVLKPYKRSLKVHTISLFTNNFVYLIFLIVVNSINFVDSINQIIIVYLGYFMTICCGSLVILSIIRIYYEYRYGEELENKIQREKQEQIQLQKKRQKQLLEIRRLKFKSEQIRKLNQRQKALKNNTFHYQNQKLQLQKEDLIQWLNKRNWTNEEKQKYFFKHFYQKPISWLQKNCKKQYEKILEERDMKKELQIKKKQSYQNDPQYVRQCNRLKAQFQCNIENINKKKLNKHQSKAKNLKDKIKGQFSFKKPDQIRSEFLK